MLCDDELVFEILFLGIFLCYISLVMRYRLLGILFTSISLSCRTDELLSSLFLHKF